MTDCEGGIPTGIHGRRFVVGSTGKCQKLIIGVRPPRAFSIRLAEGSCRRCPENRINFETRVKAEGVLFES